MSSCPGFSKHPAIIIWPVIIIINLLFGLLKHVFWSVGVSPPSLYQFNSDNKPYLVHCPAFQCKPYTENETY